MKGHLTKSGKQVVTHENMKKKWVYALKNVSKTLLQDMMGSLKIKIRILNRKSYKSL